MTWRDHRIESGRMTRAVDIAAGAVNSDPYTRSARLSYVHRLVRIDEASELRGRAERVPKLSWIEDRRGAGREPRRRAGTSELPSVRARGAPFSVVE
jgi:hypothetical protein